jgi:hypothetical protein
MNKPPLSIRLSTEELMLVLWLLNTPTLPGLGDNPFGEWSPDQISAALASAERSLRARRLVSKGEEGSIQMEQVVMALVGTCAVPEFSVVLTSEAPPTGRIVHYFHATQLLAVEHSNPEPGVHLFDALADSSALLERLQELMELDQQPAPKAKPSRVTLTLLQEATQKALQDSKQVAALFLNSGLDKDTAREFGNTLAQTRRRSALASIHHLRQETPSSDGFVVLEGPSGLWALQITGEDASAMVNLWPQSAGDIRLRLKELIAGETLTFS